MLASGAYAKRTGAAVAAVLRGWGDAAQVSIARRTLPIRIVAQSHSRAQPHTVALNALLYIRAHYFSIWMAPFFVFLVY